MHTRETASIGQFANVSVQFREQLKSQVSGFKSQLCP